ncbi:MAG: alpha/beta hydrolase [Pseudomonadota bacterium]
MSESSLPQQESSTEFQNIEFVNSGYRLVSDDSAFKDCVLAWTKKLARAEADHSNPSIDDDKMVKDYVSGAHSLLEKLSNPKEANPIDEAISEIDAAAMVITPARIVVAANVDAGDRFNAIQGMENNLDWLDPVSFADFQSVLTSTQTLTNQPSQHAILRTSSKGMTGGIAEVYVLPSNGGKSSYIVIRALETRWATAVDTTLDQTFGLTEAEREVTKALFEIRDSAQIAKLRKTTPQTTRTQIKTILRKTETRSQVDLIRLIGLLNARASHKQRSRHQAWQDPWGNYQILRRPDNRRIAYSWTGAEKGKPALIVHGSVQGYLLGDPIERRLKNEGIRLYSVIRPGFGDSDSSSESDFLDQSADAIGWLIDRLGLKDIPAIGLGNGSASLFYIAAKRPDLFSKLLVTGLVKPYSNDSIRRFTPTQKVTIKLLRYAPKTSETLARICYRYVQQKGADWYLAHGWNDVPEVQDTLKNPQIIPFIRNACELTLTANVRDYLAEMQTQWNLNPEIIRNVICPVSHLHGEFDRSVTLEEVEELRQKMPNFSSEEIPGAGYFLPYEKPDLFGSHIVKTVLS